MSDFAWIIHVIRNQSLADSQTQPYVDEFNADPAAFDAKYRSLYPQEEGEIDRLRAELA